MSSWNQGKLFIEHLLALSHNSLHIFICVPLWIVLGLLLRRRWRHGCPWLWVFALILSNETGDLWIEQRPDTGQQYGEGAKDVLLTMFIPTMIMFAVRFRPAGSVLGRGPEAPALADSHQHRRLSPQFRKFVVKA